MPGMPVEESENNDLNLNTATVREITQTDHLNKKLLTSYLNNINLNNGSELAAEKPEKTEDEQNGEEQNWDT